MDRKGCIDLQQRRADFPRGLEQPETGHRFAVDSLLLACYPRVQAGARVLDLGTGCGVAGLGLLLAGSETSIQVLGLDIDAEMVRSANANSRRLGLEHRFRAQRLDLRAMREEAEIGPESFDLVVANPPYRRPSSGRMPPDAAKRVARFELEAGAEDFVRAAAYAVKNRGKAALVYGTQRLPWLLELLSRHRLEPKRIRFIHGRERLPARLALLEARKNGGPGLEIEPPLLLYEPDPKAQRLTAQALEYCPFLRSHA
jgi:tRNA1Val (adenine37-N6)-methyltransferase